MKGEIVRVVMYSCLVIDSEYVFFLGGSRALTGI